ncbi:hypothetical protein SSX86_031087 [Deinandra increscens subsp. villosa]|uniref:Uncharacterized protein n=1 Tax=Deinandra increscens subsp. villosa TaxID=3103831 RepID=A0AAP0CAA2_9ASTR
MAGLHGFFKVILQPDLGFLPLPPAVVQLHFPQLHFPNIPPNHRITLWYSEDQHWEVGFGIRRGMLSFTHGWANVVESIPILPYYWVTFTPVSAHRYDMVVYSPNGRDVRDLNAIGVGVEQQNPNDEVDIEDDSDDDVVIIDGWGNDEEEDVGLFNDENEGINEADVPDVEVHNGDDVGQINVEAQNVVVPPVGNLPPVAVPDAPAVEPVDIPAAEHIQPEYLFDDIIIARAKFRFLARLATLANLHHEMWVDLFFENDNGEPFMVRQEMNRGQPRFNISGWMGFVNDKGIHLGRELRLRCEVDAGASIDVIGMIWKVNAPQVYGKNDDGTDKLRVNIGLNDLDGRKIWITIFQKYAQDFIEYGTNHTDETDVVLVLQYAKFSIYEGGHSITNSFDITKLFINSEIDEITTFNKSFVEIHGSRTKSPFASLSADPEYSLEKDFLSTKFNHIAELNRVDEDGLTIPDEISNIFEKRLAFKIDITSFNLDNDYRYYTVAKLIDDVGIIKSLDEKYNIEQSQFSGSVNLSSQDMLSQASSYKKDVVSVGDDDVNTLHAGEISDKKSQTRCESSNESKKIDPALKRKLNDVYDVEDSCDQSHPKNLDEVVRDDATMVKMSLLTPKLEK